MWKAVQFKIARKTKVWTSDNEREAREFTNDYNINKHL